MYECLPQENLQRKLREEREEKRRKQKEEDDKRKKAKRDAEKAAKKSEGKARGFVDLLLSGIRGGSKLRQQASAATTRESKTSKKWNQLKKGLVSAFPSSNRLPSRTTQSGGGAGESKEHSSVELLDSGSKGSANKVRLGMFMHCNCVQYHCMLHMVRMLRLLSQ